MIHLLGWQIDIASCLLYYMTNRGAGYGMQEGSTSNEDSIGLASLASSL